jgi:uncharacterized protein YggU (UPF0235/DUF167 family)
VRVGAAPADGAANAAVRRLVAGVLAVPLSDVTIAAGGNSRTKIIDVDGLDDGAVQARLSEGV